MLGGSTSPSKRRPPSRLAVCVVGLVTFASASTVTAAYVGGRSSSGAGEPGPQLEVSEPQLWSSAHVSGDTERHSRHQQTSKMAPAHIASPAASQIHPQRPVGIMLPSGAQMRVLPAVTGPTGVLQVPGDVGRAGWWDSSSRIGDPFGSIVVAAHVDSFTQGIGEFAELLDMHPGDEVRLESANLRQRFRVVTAHLEPKTSLAADSRVFAPDGDARLVLITCGGTYDPDLGGYQDNMVVIAIPEDPPAASR